MIEGRVLVIDDDNSLRNVLSGLLQMRGFVPVPVASGEDALEALKEGECAVAIVDLGLAEGCMDGFEAIEAIRKISPETECIVLTGSNSSEKRMRAERLGVRAYLRKPFDPDELFRLVRDAFQNGLPHDVNAQTKIVGLEDIHDDLVSFIHNELETPMENVLGLSQNILESESLPDAQAYARILLSEAQVVVGAVKDFLKEVEG